MSSKKKKTIVQKNNSNKIEGNISQKMQKGTVIASKQELYSGPLPPASELIKYSEAVENGAERIFNMVEGQYKHRQNLENKIIDSDIKSRNRGQFLAFIIGMTDYYYWWICTNFVRERFNRFNIINRQFINVARCLF